MKNRYNSASEFYKTIFSQRVQKISIDAGFTCPNRDGSKSRGGCTYCNNEAFKPFYCSPKKTVTQQLTEGIAFFSKKYKTQKYLAYFQAYTNTYAPLPLLKSLYEEALKVDGVIGLVIATRPDCVDAEIMDYIAELSKKYFILLEFGIESVYERTLELINRKHTFAESKYAIELANERNILTGLHFIMGLPGETKEMMLNSAKVISSLPFKLLKLHQLQIVKGTLMAKDYERNSEKYQFFGLDEYIDFAVDFLEYLNPEIIVERFTSEAPSNLLIAPKWGRVKNYEIVHKIEKKLVERDTYQGKKIIKS